MAKFARYHALYKIEFFATTLHNKKQQKKQLRVCVVYVCGGACLSSSVSLVSRAEPTCSRPALTLSLSLAVQPPDDEAEPAGRSSTAHTNTHYVQWSARSRLFMAFPGTKNVSLVNRTTCS